MLLITAIITILTFVERKVVSLLRRKVSPNVLGYRGRLQFIADTLKLLGKGLLVPAETNNLLMISLPSIVLVLYYTCCLNSFIDPSVSILGVECNVADIFILFSLFSFVIIFTGSRSRNKYCLLAAIRCSVLIISLDAVMGILILNITVSFSSFVLMTSCVAQQ
jgi:NADH-quinone oxidoreductase subunit H